jgi:hypothetical protein
MMKIINGEMKMKMAAWQYYRRNIRRKYQRKRSAQRVPPRRASMTAAQRSETWRNGVMANSGMAWRRISMAAAAWHLAMAS